jgi:hypothetical protein
VPDRSATSQHAPAMAEEHRRIGGRVEVKNADGANAGAGEPGGAVAGQVELPVLFPPSRREEARMLGFVCQDRTAEVRADLV